MCHLPQPRSPAYPQAISGIQGVGRLESGTCSLLAIRRGSSACRYGNAYQYAVILYLRFSALRTDLRRNAHAEYIAASCHQQCSKIIRADCGELRSEFGTEL
jgi:hypothetical protein